MSGKVGLYVCTGCEIGRCLDAERLTKIASGDPSIGSVRISSAFCLEDAHLIGRDIESGGIERVVIAACSPRVNTDVFTFAGASVERVNLREQVVWSHAPGHSDTQELAEDYVRMGLVRAQKIKPAVPYTEANDQTVLVIGGGVAGLNAALSAAQAGFAVELVEQTAHLGGYARRFHKQFPMRPPYRDLEASSLASLVRDVETSPAIRVRTQAEVAGISGQPGRYEVTIQQGRQVERIRAGAIVLATGWTRGSTSDGLYGLGAYPDVVDSLSLEDMAATGRIARPSNGSPVKRVALVVCDGPDDDAHLAYGGQVASLVALKQALYIREQSPDALVYIVSGDMQTPGQHEYFYKRVQEDSRILFSRGEVQGVSEDAERRIVLDVANTVLGPAIRLVVDLLVVSTDMVPTSKRDGEGGALHLRYLQGEELPTTPFGFADSHFICFPYETRRTGIYSAGAVRQPMDIASSARDGAAAALKAMQAIRHSSAGTAVHPRVGDLSYPEFFMQKCTSCGRCSQECPFGALEVDEKRHPALDPNRCRRCGICMGACPVQIISFSDYSVEILSKMISAVEVPEDPEKVRILALACENDAYPALDLAGIGRLQYSAYVRVIPVRCLGSVNAVLIADAVSRGFDGVALLGCRAGEDYQCHFIRGSELLAVRMQNVQETLDRLALEAERVRFLEVEISDAQKLPGLLEDFVDTVKRLGPNPMKGF